MEASDHCNRPPLFIGGLKWGLILMFMRSLFVRLPLLFFSLVVSDFIFAKATTFYSPNMPGSYFVSPDALCKAAFSQADNPPSPPVHVVSIHGSEGNGCTYRYFLESSPSNVRVNGFYVGGTVVAINSAYCDVGASVTFNWPLGIRDAASEYGILPGTQMAPPSRTCVDGCYAVLVPGTPSCYSDGYDGSVTYCDYPGAVEDQACNTPDHVPPDITPPAPGGGDGDGDTGGDTGGGDTGGGDTGGGDTGSGDTGGGDTGGGDTGGGGTGGGGTGGGDTGGGDTGGGDTGGGDTGGGDTGGGDTGGGDTGGGNTGGGGGDDSDGSASGLGCDKPLVCTGDAVQCALLQVQKAQACADEKARDFEGHKGQIESLFSGTEYSRDNEEEITVPSFVDGITRFLPSNTCPADATVSLGSFGGRTLRFSFEPICSFATILGPLIVIAATVFSALYVGRSFGGE